MWTIEELDKLTIKHGNHERPNGKVEACAMEAAYLRWAVRQVWPKKQIVEGWTDSVDCVCPTIGAHRADVRRQPRRGIQGGWDGGDVKVKPKKKAHRKHKVRPAPFWMIGPTSEGRVIVQIDLQRFKP